jgi:hypothetical protein
MSNEPTLMNDEIHDIVDFMSEEHFKERLRELVRRQPFIPFAVHFVDGRRLVVERPWVVFSSSQAGYLSDTEGIVDFSCGEVQAMEFLTAETAS